MSIDFSKLTGWSTSKGAVTQVADSQGRIIWMVQSGDTVILEVEKITSDTYAGETTYTGEQFILLDIYPKTNGTVKVTYGGLTKTIRDTSGAEEPNAQQVFFGTFNGVSDGVETPASGELTIEGSFRAFGVGEYNRMGSKLETVYCGCIMSVIEWGEITSIPSNGFRNCDSLDFTTTPSQVVDIGSGAFYGCDGLTSFVVPEGIVSVGNGTFENCGMLSHITFPATLKTLGSNVVFKTVNVSGYVPYTVKMLATTPPAFTVTSNFNFIQKSGNNSGNIIVPKGCGELYKTADGWSDYADYIVEAS